MDAETLTLLSLVLFLGGFVCGAGVIGLWWVCQISRITRQQNPFRMGRHRIDDIFRDLRN